MSCHPDRHHRSRPAKLPALLERMGRLAYQVNLVPLVLLEKGDNRAIRAYLANQENLDVWECLVK